MKKSSRIFLLASCLLGIAHFCSAQTATINLLKASNDFANPAWLNKNAVIAKSDVLDPAGKKEAYRITSKAYVLQVIKTATPGRTYLFSVWLKSATGAAQKVNLSAENNLPKIISETKSFDLADQWQRVSIAFTCPPEGNLNFRFSIRDGDVLAWHPQVEDITGKTSAEPSPYQETL